MKCKHSLILLRLWWRTKNPLVGDRAAVGPKGQILHSYYVLNYLFFPFFLWHKCFGWFRIGLTLGLSSWHTFCIPSFALTTLAGFPLFEFLCYFYQREKILHFLMKNEITRNLIQGFSWVSVSFIWERGPRKSSFDFPRLKVQILKSFILV